MIFDNKSIFEIEDGEIHRLVTEHFGERQHLEFKATVNCRDDKERIEILRDIASLANGGGGYLIIGIRDDRNGRAQKYEPKLMKNPDAIKKAIYHLCIEYISERIEGLEIDTREVKGNPIVIMRIPESLRTPHMATYNNSTDFYTRYHDGKRAMTIGEIKEAFSKDLVGRELSGIKAILRQIERKLKIQEERDEILESIKQGTKPQLVTIENGSILQEAAFGLFKNEIGKTPYFWISATPLNPRKDLIDVDSDNVRQLIMKPPGSRYAGWNMKLEYYQVERTIDGISIGEKVYRFLKLMENAHMEFWTPLNENFCLGQSINEFKKQPRLFPYPLIEFPTSFLRLYRSIIDVFEIKDDILIRVHYSNLNGYILPPYAPGIIGFDFPHRELKPYKNPNLDLSGRKVGSDFEPDKTTYEIIKSVYKDFLLKEETIPFYNRENENFDFPG